MRTRRDPVVLLRFALREGDDRLAELLLRRLRRHPALAARTDRELASLPRRHPDVAGRGDES